MRKMERFITRNWLWITLGCVLQKKAIELAYQERGFIAVGAEWFVLPIILLIVAIIRGMAQSIIELKEEKSDRAVMGNRRRVPRKRSSDYGRGSRRSM